MRRIFGLSCVFALGIIITSCNSGTKENKEEQNVKNETEQLQDENQNNETDAETKNFDEEQILSLSELENGDVYNDLIVADYQYDPYDSFGFTLKGEFILSGQLMIDEMWGELSVIIDDENNPHKNLKLESDGYSKQLIGFCYFSNSDILMTELTEEQKESLNSGEPVSVKMKVKDFSIGGKVDGYAECYIEFVEFAD